MIFAQIWALGYERSCCRRDLVQSVIFDGFKVSGQFFLHACVKCRDSTGRYGEIVIFDRGGGRGRLPRSRGDLEECAICNGRGATNILGDNIRRESGLGHRARATDLLDGYRAKDGAISIRWRKMATVCSCLQLSGLCMTGTHTLVRVTAHLVFIS
jgi:hypothetical protein